MKISLYMAISIDGFITYEKDDSSWVSEFDWPEFQQFIKNNDVIMMGRRTYEKGIEEKVFPYEGAKNVVVTSDKKLLAQKQTDKVMFTSLNPAEALRMLEKSGKNKIGIIGGGHLNGSMLKEGLIDEIYLDVHPLILGSGINLFEEFERKVDLELLEEKVLNNKLVLLHYKVLKNNK